MRAAALALLALVACKDEPTTERPAPAEPKVPSPPATVAECDAASEGGMAEAGIASDLRLTRVGLIRMRCLEDRWSAEAARCYAKAAGYVEAWNCELPAEAQWKLSDALKTATQSRLGLPPLER